MPAKPLILPYNPDWPMLFAHAAGALKEVLGDNCLAVHHIGSTAVEGLASKPIIDIIAVIQSQVGVVALLEANGYHYQGEYGIPMRLYFNKADINLHVYANGNPEIELNLLFRDYLRHHPEAREEYARLKTELARQDLSSQDLSSTEYSLGKDTFIREILQRTGYHRLRLMHCTHHAEWEEAKRFRQQYFFDNVPIADPYTWTFHHPEHAHFVLYQGTTIIGYAHILLWPEQRAAMRIIVIEESERNQGFGSKFLALLEEWLKSQAYKTIHAESRPAALAFYRQHGYIDMPFDDPEGHATLPPDIAIGKIL